MSLPSSHHPTSRTPVGWLTGGVALVLAICVLAVELLGPRFGLWGRGPAGSRLVSEPVAVVETHPGADGEPPLSGVDGDRWQPERTVAGADRGVEPRRSARGRADQTTSADDRDHSVRPRVPTTCSRPGIAWNSGSPRPWHGLASR